MTHGTLTRIIGAALLASTLMLAACAKPTPPVAPVEVAFVPPIIPAPAEAFAEQGEFLLNATTPVIARGAAVEVANYFSDLMKRTRGFGLAIRDVGDESTPGITFEVSGTVKTAEGYALLVKPDGILVMAKDRKGLLYGAVSLWQLATARVPADTEAALAIPAMTIGDEPRFAWRGLMLDSVRHFQSPEFVKKFIDWMALHKLNVLHWHLTDDQGWRLEIKKYPKLTRVGAWRVPAGAAALADIDPATQRPRTIGGFYTQQQVRDIVAFAAARNVTIVPEIEMPGHASAAVVAYPELGVSRTLPKAVPSDWGVYTTLFNAEEPTFRFLEDVLGEVSALFPGEYVHVGGDEAVKDEWQASPRIQQRMKELGVQDEHALQGSFIQRMEKFLAARGKKLIGWDEILEGGIAPNATVMSWRGIDGAIAAAKAGHDTVLSPAPQLYLDHWQSDGDPAPGRSNVLSLRQVYEFDPIPAAIGPAERKHVLGVQANLWAEFMRSEERVEYQAFPRAAALAEIAWSAPNRIGWEGFSARMPAQLARYDALGIRYAKRTEWPAPVANARTSHQLAMCGDGYLLSLEDDAPVTGERAVFLVNISDPCWVWKDVDLARPQRIVATVGQIPFNFQIGKDAAGIPLPPPATPAGELEIRAGACDSAPLATIPLAGAATNQALTTLPAASLAARGGRQDLCFRFTRARLDPMWVIDRIALEDAGP